MNREIKFRAWTGKKMLSSDEFDYVSSNGFAAAFEHVPYEEPMAVNSESLMQYTGLKDKDGQEIYEGDILNDRMIAIEHKYIKSKCVVIFNNGAFLANPINKEAKGTQYINGTDVVIGNIHKNPELLK